jgi:protein-S-isoprenylcysteine O-methyltransferase Ste14
MNNIVMGVFGFLVIHIVDFVSLKKIPLLKPLIWILGIGLWIYSFIMICLASDKLLLPIWSTWFGWILLTISILVFLYALFINLPFRKTYVATGVGDKLVKTGLYALARHPGAIWFILFMLSSILVSKSSLMSVAAPIYIVLNTLLVVIQDKFFFPRMFTGYDIYQQETPMLVPDRRSINAFIKSLQQAKTQNGLQGGKQNGYTR